MVFLFACVIESLTFSHFQHDTDHHFPNVKSCVVNHGCSKIVNSNLDYQARFAILQKFVLTYLNQPVLNPIFRHLLVGLSRYVQIGKPSKVRDDLDLNKVWQFLVWRPKFHQLLINHVSQKLLDSFLVKIHVDVDHCQ